MKIVFKEIRVSTSTRMDLVDVTDEVEDFVQKSGIENGLCLVYAPHATAAIIANEHEGGLMQDILRKAEKDFPRGAGWLHDRIDDNANAHLASAFIASSRIFPVKGARIVRGTWQNIFLLDLDGPRDRRILIEAMGE